MGREDIAGNQRRFYKHQFGELQHAAPLPDAPLNVAVQLCEFEDLAKRIRRHFEFEISLERPYKLCDFRPAFGEIFADELTGYDFWGHSDLDLDFGRIRGHLSRTSGRPPGTRT
jgi:hypothetical protein